MGNPPRPSPLPSATRIIATVGPATSSERVLRRTILAGVDVFRFNMSHGDHDSHRASLARVRNVARTLGRPVGVLVDLQGPKIRTRKNVTDEWIPLRRGETLTMSAGAGASEPGHVRVDFPGLFDGIETGDALLLDDGRLAVRVGPQRRGARASSGPDPAH